MKRLMYLGASLSAAAYAAWLELRPLKYHADVVWPNVTGGIALTGVWVAVRFAAEGRPRSLAWAWSQMFLMFCATGAPVIAWELWAKGRRGRHVIAWLRGDSHANPAASTGKSSPTTGPDR